MVVPWYTAEQRWTDVVGGDRSPLATDNRYERTAPTALIGVGNRDVVLSTKGGGHLRGGLFLSPKKKSASLPT